MTASSGTFVGSAPGWGEPWSRARLAHVEQDASGWRTWLVDESGSPIDEADVQRARLSIPLPSCLARTEASPV
ncbi:MAG: hypothetical protein IPF92_07795 [Myxococcales bacterium]|nr:hypothetical protein [Myxococcales bacterium]MBL0193361.1 hypothetical protein [Myxococcales bacterium]HQY64141.1 hypothetical protein [Polyangiaceae bacterium]